MMTISGNGALWEKGYDEAIARAILETANINKDVGAELLFRLITCTEEDKYLTEREFMKRES